MSRCFPFPPPGYERARNDDVESLPKEKHKEKRHKKEKKDKEKGEGKDKKDRERSKDKHREKKEKKEKRKDKKRDRDKENEKNSTPDDRTVKGKSEGRNEEKPGESSFGAVDHMETKLTEELAKRIKDEARQAENQEFRETIGPVQSRIESVSSTRDQRRVKTLGRAVEKGIEQKEKKEGEDKRPERQRDGGGGRTTENKMGQNITSTDKNAGHRRIEGKEKNRDKKSKGDDRRGDRHEDKKREEKRSERVDKERDKEKEKKRDKVKEKYEDRDKEWGDLKGSQQQQINTTIFKAPLPQNGNDSEKNVDFEVNLKKRKDFQTNGFVYGNDLHPTKLPRLASSSLMPLENGRNSGQSHVAIQFSDSHGETNGRKGEINKEHKVNGAIEVKPSTVISRPPVPPDPPFNREASKKPPHPDSICLSQLLLVPKMAEWPEFDDQEWLFSSSSLQSKPKAASGVTETAEVWGQAVRIESADVCALPYVIPY